MAYVRSEKSATQTILASSAAVRIAQPDSVQVLVRGKVQMCQIERRIVG